MTTMAKAQGQEVTEEDQEEMIRQAKHEMDGGKVETAMNGGAKDSAEEGTKDASETSL